MMRPVAGTIGFCFRPNGKGAYCVRFPAHSGRCDFSIDKNGNAIEDGEQ